MTRKEHCKIKGNANSFQDYELGNFIEGYSTALDCLVTTSDWWMLVFLFFLGFIGLAIDLIIILNRFLKRRYFNKISILMFEEGFVWEEKSLSNKETTVVRNEEIGAINCDKTQNYVRINFVFTFYKGTTFFFHICDKKNRGIFYKEFNYWNKSETPDDYNAPAFAVNAIIERWRNLSILKEINE